MTHTTDPEAASIVLYEAIDAWNRHDIDGYIRCLAKDIYWDDPAASSPMHGHHEIRAFLTSLLRAFPDLRIRLVEPLYLQEEGTHFAAHFRIEGTMTGRLDPPGLEPTNRRIIIDDVDLVEIQRGLITRIVSRFDVLRTARQAGTLAEPPTPRPNFTTRLYQRLKQLLAA